MQKQEVAAEVPLNLCERQVYEDESEESLDQYSCSSCVARSRLFPGEVDSPLAQRHVCLGKWNVRRSPVCVLPRVRRSHWTRLVYMHTGLGPDVDDAEAGYFSNRRVSCAVGGSGELACRKFTRAAVNVAIGGESVYSNRAYR